MDVRPPRKLVRALDQVPEPERERDRAALAEVRRVLELLAEAEAGPEGKAGIRDWIAAELRAALSGEGLDGLIAEIGGSRNGLKQQLPEWEFTYLSLYPGDGPDMLVADITSCPQIPDESFDAVVSVNCFEHIDRPWRAAEEITRILRPGGITFHVAPFSYFYHRAPVDHWRYTPEGLSSLFPDLEPLRAEFYGANRRRNNLGSANNAVDRDGGPAFAPDAFGGWRENWYAVYLGRKTPGWRTSRIQRELHQVVVDVCKALEPHGLAPDDIPAAAAEALADLTITDAGEVRRATDGVGLGLTSDDVGHIWRNRGKLGIKPSFRRYTTLAISGHPKGRHAAT